MLGFGVEALAALVCLPFVMNFSEPFISQVFELLDYRIIGNENDWAPVEWIFFVVSASVV